ncbi:MAG TPA: alpha-amylase family glycosyl hydrolase [Thermoanaerobaculia bacterium]|nr:alpha-amylase family glycosyl hydrolase [Thermoanaerobaculia bacterium]
MRELVLVAKHTPVWLDQLARAHRRPITRLDQIPDEALARLSNDGFTGLWLVGIWERSPASAAIKRRRGQPSAGASAYSIFEYRVADSLGGDDAAEQLQERALRHGIRLAVDVVPNHVGIDSRWVREHPDWLLQVDRAPFPRYRFAGPDLSGDPEIGIYLEDHYDDHSDAAVVFRLLERRSGRERFIYHGNDGTHTPWNDTAQLDYTRPEVRTAMRELIAGLARRFPVLRFDSAMTLARRHFLRLWFPAPGDEGAVPSRRNHRVSPAELARRMPEEPWREITRQVSLEAPGTLLLAEAFWLMEAYFVRELGMHRVYNSAFMHRLVAGESEKLVELVAGTLRLEPGLLGRYANFLTTPDEAPAAEQLGRGDRYFGACAVLASFPGLPLFGHGQVEGLEEKYGMEFVRALQDEEPDPALIERHRREIVPLLRLRSRLGAPASFVPLELVDERRGSVRGEVFAYCSGAGAEAVVVAFNNSPVTVRGFLAPRGLRRGEDPDTPALAERLGAGTAGGAALRFRDLRHGDESTRPISEVASGGLALLLGPWQSVAWGDFRLVR